MASCKFCLNESCDSWYSSYCKRCHKLQRVIHLFTIDKVMNIIENVLIVDEETQKEKIKDQLKTELTTREYNLRKRREEKKESEN
jgi:hypothetical protein